jgi:hypothetical protein
LLLRLATVAQITPALLRYLYSEPLGGFRDALPSSVALIVVNALDLVEASYSVPDVTCVDQRLFPLLGEGELVVAQLILLSCAQSVGHLDSPVQ